MKNLFIGIKEFYGQNNRLLRKFWVNQITCSILGVMVTWPMTVLISNNPQLGNWPYMAACLFCSGFFCFLIYDIFFEIGAKDYIKVNHQNEKYDKYKPVKIALFAYSPTLLSCILGIFFYLFNINGGQGIISIIMNMILHAMYSGLFFTLDKSLNVITYPISILVTVFFAFLGYYLASHDKTLRGVFGIKTKFNKE